jgi:hypothetical protein
MTIRSGHAYLLLGAAFVAAVALMADASPASNAPDAHERLWSDLLARPGGPGGFRFYLQPTMAAIAALRDAIVDARAGRSPFLWNLVTVPAERAARLREGLNRTRRVMLFGVVMDSVYQFAILKAFYPLEMMLVVLLLCFVPYLLLRGPFTRIARWWLMRGIVR